MKNILIALFVICGFAASAQSTSPRFGTTAGRDNTYRVLSLAKSTLTDAAGNDTVSVTPKNYTTYYYVAAVDSVTLKIGSTATSYYGDQINLMVTGTTGKIVRFIGSNLLTSGTATLSSNGRASIQFTFDGSKWVESYRTVQ